MGIFTLWKKSVYSPEFYREVLGKSFSFSIKYFYSVVLVLAVALTIGISVDLVPKAYAFLRDLGPAILDYFPSELEVRIKDGTASSNVTEPYALPLPDELRQFMKSSEGVAPRAKNLFVIDTRGSFSEEEFKNYDTLVLLTKNSVAWQNEKKGKIELQTLDQTPNTTINKKKVSELVDVVNRLSRWVIPFFIFAIFAFMMVVLSFHLVYLLLAAFLIWFLGRIKKTGIGYKKAYQVGLHAMSLGMAFDFFAFFLAPGARVRFLFTILMLVVAWINLPSGEVPSPEAPPRVA